jgi:hypothetical protein
MTRMQKRPVLWAWLFLLIGFLTIFFRVDEKKASLCAAEKGSR